MPSFSGLRYRQVDVFARAPLSGNGLAVFFDCEELSGADMQAVTREMRQYESIFLCAAGAPDTFRARIFTMEEELAFAGHPVLGAAAALHEAADAGEKAAWRLVLAAKTVAVSTRDEPGGYRATMNQGRAEFGAALDGAVSSSFLAAMGFPAAAALPDFPPQVVSTGLPYLIVPVAGGLERARVAVPDLAARLAPLGAAFAYVLDVARLEGRTWDNLGRDEDIATGSAAGPVAAYLASRGAVALDRDITLHQGRFLGRPSEITMRLAGQTLASAEVLVSGSVRPVARGVFD